jgi:hypothetical protein
MEMIFPLFAEADRGVFEDEYPSPGVRLALKNAAFSWWNLYRTSGGNYEQDNFNHWSAEPLVLTFDTLSADVVWTNYFFRVASTTTAFRTNTTSLFSIFDEVMDTDDRWYVRERKALYPDDRYNIQKFPVLKGKTERDYVDADYRIPVSGMLGLGLEFDWISAVVKVASNQGGRENIENAWLVGADLEVIPIENLKVGLTGFAGINYEKTSVGENPANVGISAEYRLPLSDRYFLTPRAGFDFAMDTESGDSVWELGAGVLFHTRGYDFLSSSRVLDWAEIIPVGASLFMNINQDNGFNAMLSVFEPAGPDSMLPNFGGFLQLELANVLEVNEEKSAFGVLAQFEYLIAGKFTPYIRVGYSPEFQSGSNSLITGDYLVKGALGLFVTAIHFFSIDVRYEMDAKLSESGDSEATKNLFSAVFTVRM